MDKKIVFLFCLMFPSLAISNDHFTGSYCELEGAYTDSGKYVYGEFWMYSNDYGEADSAYTEDGDAVYGECYRYNGRYCELEGAYTSIGENVYGECYIYWYLFHKQK